MDMDKCKNYKNVMKNFTDDRMSPTFRWHLRYGPGHLFGKLPGSKYFRSSLGIKCTQPMCETMCRAEKEVVRHYKFQHPGKKFKRTPNSKYCFEIDTRMVEEGNYDRTIDFIISNKRAKSGPERALGKASQSKKTRKEKCKISSKTHSDSPVVMDSSLVVDARIQAASSDSGNMVNSVSSSTPALSTTSQIVTPPFLSLVMESSPSISALPVTVGYDSPEASSTTDGDMLDLSTEDLFPILGETEPPIMELNEFRKNVPSDYESLLEAHYRLFLKYKHLEKSSK